ncbi:NIPSNAP family protein [Streptomyces boluensis]|uniref:NIPSNAP family protein n=1 Tax=Streptomyces boluensis TaxID=1775135 RepID=A0A964UV71_9ACTN|nr:NIPSNAP family protein [Streptomyces boluensis]NBE55991.1 NIPSNAP family protein [Streptomyces boluensis]
MPGTAPVGHPAVIELRQYTLRPGRRDELIELFDREFVETQEETGMIVLGQFRDLDDPDRFVWLRGFEDMEARREALSAFYGGPVWAAHGPQANATMVDSDNVLLLRPPPDRRGFAVTPSERQRAGAAAPDRFVAAALWHFPPGTHDGTELIQNRLVPLLRQTGPAPLAVLATEPAANTFPRLPVRTGENIVAVFTSYPDEAAHHRHVADATAHPLVRNEILPGIERAQATAPLFLRLAPTARSLIR